MTKPILIHEPVWNGGNQFNKYRGTYLSVKTDRILKGANFVECDYTNKHGDRTFELIYYVPSTYCDKIHTERWGKAYHAYLKELETCQFWFTIRWESPDGRFKGEKTSNRPRFDYMLEGINDYLIEWRERDAYLECCSLQTSKKTYFVNLTDYAKDKLESVPNVCNAYRSVVTRRLTKETA